MVQWNCKYDKVKSYIQKLQCVFYFTDYPVKIVCSTDLVGQYNDDEGTHIKTKRSRFDFSWNFGQNMITTTHSAN